MIEDRIIVCLASNWRIDPTSKHQVMKLLSQRNHVLWVNYHASRRPQASVRDVRAVVWKLGQVFGGVEDVSPRLHVLTPMVVPLPGLPGAATVNRTLLVRQIQQAMGRLPRRPVQVWSFAPETTIPSALLLTILRSMALFWPEGGAERSPLGSIIPQAIICPFR